MSGFREAELDGSHYRHDLHLSEKEVIRVPVFKPENMGEAMAIDEKQIGEERNAHDTQQSTEWEDSNDD